MARLIGAAPGEVVCTDSTSINLYKVLFAALSQIAAPTRAAAWWSASAATSRPTSTSPSRCAASAASRCELIDASELPAALDDEVAVLMLTHVNYRTGAMHDMEALTPPPTPPARSRCGTWRTARARCRWR